jgi:two-component system LytT family response regulator
MLLRALIVDDEELAREGIRLMLASQPDIEVVGEAADGPSATEAISRLSPDVIFLDVRMPGFDGFEVLDRIAGPHQPHVVFITAYDEYAVRAFEENAIDYLLKPVNVQRLGGAVQRVRAHVAQRSDFADSDEAHPLGPSDPRKTIVVKDRDRFLVVKTSDIDWFESAANYVELHVHRRSFLVRMTMNELQARLKGTCFVRIHRSTIVNLDRVTEFRPSPHGDFQVHLTDGHVLRLSRAYRDQLLP